MNYEQWNKNILIGILIAITIHSFFSYPFKYASIPLILSVLLFPVIYHSNFIQYLRCSYIKLGIVIIGLVTTISFIATLNVSIKWAKFPNTTDNNTIAQLENLVPFLKNNHYFLYNYAAQLNKIGRYNDSQEVLSLYHQKIMDYESQLLLANNYLNKHDTINALKSYQIASNMIPCRFMPLYYIFTINKHKDPYKAVEIANKIINKDVKINSLEVLSIKLYAKKYIDSISTSTLPNYN